MVAAKISALLALLAIAAGPAIATVVVTQPVASTTGHGGKRLDVEWNDSSVAPKLSDWGSVNIYLATGSHDVQFKLQTLATNVDASTTSGRYRIDPSVGPSGGAYFIRFEGTKPAPGSNDPPMAFSARFTLDDMDGSFNSTIQSELDSPGGTRSAGGAASATRGVSANSVASATSTGAGNSMATARASSTSTSPAAANTAAKPAATTSGASSPAGRLELATGATVLTALVAAGVALF